MDDINLGLYPQPRLCPLDLTTNYMVCSGVCVFTVELLWTVFHFLLPPPTPASPPQLHWPKIGMHLQKNDLTWPKIKQVTNSKLYYIKFNISISTILLNKASQTRAKAGCTNYVQLKMRISTIIPRCKLGQFSCGWSHIRTHLYFVYF